MNIGFYSERARECRNEFRRLPAESSLRHVMLFADFHSVSELRDLLFHVQVLFSARRATFHHRGPRARPSALPHTSSPRCAAVRAFDSKALTSFLRFMQHLDQL
jgi:hypothetical protein